MEQTVIKNYFASETLATSSENTPEAPCTGWVAGPGGCSPNFDCSALSTNDAEVLNQLSTIYPNPNNGSFTLSYSGQEQLKQLSVFDVTGKKVNTIILNNFNQRKDINLNTLAKGLYFITIESETTNTTKKMVIK